MLIENPEVVTETVTPEVQTIDPATTDITAPGLTDYPEPEYPEYPEIPISGRRRGGNSFSNKDDNVYKSQSIKNID